MNNTHHSDSRGGQDLLRHHSGEVSHIGKCVDDRNDDAGNEYGQRQISLRILHLFNHTVEVIPSVVSEQTRIEGHGDASQIPVRIGEWILKGVNPS